MTDVKSQLLVWLMIGVVLLLWFGFVSRGGLGHEYYSGSARTLAGNPRWLLSGAFDSGGHVTVDKPPIGLWPTALGVAVFGPNAWGFILPNALLAATVGQSSDALRGGRGNDELHGGRGHDLLIGGEGSDTLNGGDGRDILLGRRGSDILSGDAGNDLLRGGKGVDNARGGAGHDVCRAETRTGCESNRRFW